MPKLDRETLMETYKRMGFSWEDSNKLWQDYSKAWDNNNIEIVDTGLTHRANGPIDLFLMKMEQPKP